jgi:hypothetical protein
MAKGAAKHSLDLQTAKIRRFANEELALLVSDLYTYGVSVPIDKVVGGLVFGARRSPIEAVAAVVQTYVRLEAEKASEAALSEPNDDPG